MSVMNLAAESAVTVKNKLEFPNLFGGTEIEYYRGFEVFGVPIYWYGVLIAVGIVLACVYVFHRMEKDFGLSKDRAFDVIFAATIGGFIGARIYFCVFTSLDPTSLKKYDFVTTFTEIRDGGIAIYGGIIAAVLVGFLFCKLRKVHFTTMLDVAALGFLIGQTIGRWGNFVNQEAYGADCPTDWLFAMKGSLITSQGITGVVHPCFLYESVWCLLGFIFLHIYSKKLRTFDGEVFLLYVAWYGLERFFVEGLRTDSLMAGDFRISQIVAAVSCIAALILFVIFKILTKKKNIPLYVNSGASQTLLENDRKAEEERLAKKAEKKNKKSPSILGEEAEENEEKSEETEAVEDAEEAAADSEETEKNSENSEETEAAEDVEKTVEEAAEPEEKSE
ncbi:MAG: prolipoprotein diacylglyceryl transferase [Oscillospiraceae bacterium]|nr:prolipoprotein diacylglyceryl transferase [Oscillospiraceae bacterium]